MAQDPIRRIIRVRKDEIPKTGQIIFKMLTDHEMVILPEDSQIQLPWLVTYIYKPWKLFRNGDCLFRLDRVRISKD